MRPIRFTSRSNRNPFRKSISRKITSFVLLSLFIFPVTDLAHQAPFFASSAIKLTANYSRIVSKALASLFTASAANIRRETTADRTASVTNIRITPAKIVGYKNQPIKFSAVGSNTDGQTIQGAQLSWSSSDSEKLTIDSSGLAKLNGAGLVWVTASTPSVSNRVPVLIKQGIPSVQTDGEWKTDQEKLRLDGTIGPASDTVDAILNSALKGLMPTAHAQTAGSDSGDFLYDELWSEPRNLVGLPRNRVKTSSAIGTILPESSNFEFSIPLYGLPGRGVSADIALNYNSRIWSRHGSAVTFNAVNSWPFLGFTLSFGRIVTYGTTSSSKFVLIDEDGTRYYLGTGSIWTGSTYQTSDGSHITYVGDGYYGGTLYYNNGVRKGVTRVNNRLMVTTVTDPNGNYINIGYASQPYQPINCALPSSHQWMQAIDTVTDTLGRVVKFNYDDCNNLVSIDVPGYGGTSGTPVTTTIARFDYALATPSTSYSGLTVENTPLSIPSVELKHAYFPATQTGYKFTYSAYGMITTVSSRKGMSYNSGTGAISDGTEKAYVSFNYPATASSLTDAPSFSQWTQSPAATSGGTATYSFASSSGSGTKIFTITNPDSSTATLTRSDTSGTTAYGLLIQGEVKTSGGTSMSKSVVSYTTDGGGETQIANVINYDDGNPTPNQTKLDYDYDSYGNVTNTREYGFQQSGAWVVRRRTRDVYKTDTSYINVYLRSLLIERDTYDAQLDTNDANDVLMAKTTYTYDDYTAMGGMEDYGGTTYSLGHLAYGTTVIVRGNVTGVTEYTDVTAPTSIIHLRKLDIFGNIVKEELSCCNQQVMNTDSTNGYLMPVTIVKGVPSGPTVTMTYDSDFNTSLQKSKMDTNSQTTTIVSRDAALRPTQTDLPTGETRTSSYNDSSQTVSRSITYDDGGTSKTITETLIYDGWGRLIQKVAATGGQVNTNYDNMGRVASVTNPFAAGGTPSYSTSYSYDALGRKTTMTFPDSQVVTTAYNGSIVTITDQVNRKIQRQSDGLGRLLTVNEQNSSGTLSQATNYSYNVLNKLTEVNQGNQLRQFKYDAMSRLLYEKIPEQTASINDGTGTLWTCKYTYTDFNAFATRQDARGVVTTYSYDGLNRLSQVSYNTVSGVTTAPTVTYIYDSDSGTGYSTTAAGKLLRINVGSDYKERYTFDSNYRVASTVRTIGTRSYTTSYGYNEASQMTQLTYASGLAIGANYNSIGQGTSLKNATTLANYMSGISYDIMGQVTSDTLGNGITEQFGYDAQRIQLTSQKAGTSSPYTDRLDLTYSYVASAGSSGAGSTAGNAGQLMGVSGSINATTESASYTYNNVGSLVTSNQVSNGSSAQRRFEYDQWGNRSKVWDATSGGTQIQSVSLQMIFFPGGSARTNRITSVTNNGVTVNYTYDAAGNVTNDGNHTYAYDSESRMVSIDSGAASYAYDHSNRRYKKTVSSTVTHYVWEGSQVLAEHNGSTGSALVDYIYRGSRMIAKIASGTINYFLGDRLSIRAVLNSTGGVVGRQAYLPFGEDFAESGTQQKQHFTSYERDSESGLDYAINRYYAPAVGRFVSADRYRASGHTDDPRSWNRYSYTRNVVTNRVDPLGLDDMGAYEDLPPPRYPHLLPNDSISVWGGATTLGTGMPGYFGTVPAIRLMNVDGVGHGPATLVQYGGLNPCERRVWDSLGVIERKIIYDARNTAWDAAKKVAKEYPPADNNGFPPDGSYGNGVQHCVWNCEMCKNLVDRNVAKRIAEAHECNDQGQPVHDEGSEMDRHNNAVGQRYGKEKDVNCEDRCRNGGDLVVINNPKGPYE
jgi:RHS repeat-associated protein